MEEFSDLDDETGTNIVHLNDVEISRNIVEPIDYQLPDVCKNINKNRFTNLYSNSNNNFINLDNNVDRYFSKKYVNDFDRIIDENLNNNLRTYEHPFGNNFNNYNNICENHHSHPNNIAKENPKMNKLLEIQKNYNKINHKKGHFVDNKVNNDKENSEKNILNPPDYAFSSKIYYINSLIFNLRFL